MSIIEQAIAIRQAMDTASAVLTDEQALECIRLYKTWSSLVREKHVAEKAGYRFCHGDCLFKTLQANYMFIDIYEPGSIGTESLFAKIDETHAGTFEDPIPYDGNMELFEGEYYSQNEVIYLCTRPTEMPVYHALIDLVGLYVETVM